MTIKSFFKAIGRRLFNTSVNVDRTAASLVLGTPEDETISGWSGANKDNNPVAKVLDKSLDGVHFAGDPHHAEDAAAEDAVLVKARQDYDQTNKH